MRLRIALVVGIVIGAVLLGLRYGPALPALKAPPVAQVALKDHLTDFNLLDHSGNSNALYRLSDKKAIVIIGHGLSCPILQKSSLKINALVDKYGPQNVEFLAINPNQEDSRDKIVKEVADFGLKIPILLDPSQVVTRELGLTRTSEAVIILPHNWQIVYRGPLDDELGYGVNKQRVGTPFLSNALDEVLSNRKISHNEEPTKGCLFSFFARENVSFKKDVLPVLQTRCLTCHSAGNRFPPLFEDHATLKRWSAMIRETVFTERMPPFSGDSHYGQIANDSSLSPEQKRTLVSWIDQGAQNDYGPGPLPKPIYAYTKDKYVKNKIYTAAMPNPIVIPPGGTPEYQYFQLGEAVPEDYWVSAVNMISTNPRQLHHASLMIVPNPLSFYAAKAKAKGGDQEYADTHDGDISPFIFRSIQRIQSNFPDSNYIRYQVWGAGRRQPSVLRNKFALFLPKGYYLILEAHYMGTGKSETEKTTLEFFGSRQADGRTQMHGRLVGTERITIPPGVKRFVVKGDPTPVRRDLDLWGFLAHMHMRGKSLKLMQIDPSGNESVLISIPNFYYGWQTGSGVSLKTPKRVLAGSKLQVVCEYDNSAQNPNNPDPQKTVRFGQRVDRTEMCHVGTIFTYVTEGSPIP